MNILSWLLVLLVRLYRWTLSPLKSTVFGPAARCRYHPTCSEYALEALARHGPIRGGWMSIRRICRCHPWGGCGADPVPELGRPAAGERRQERGESGGEPGIGENSLVFCDQPEGRL
jgi:hypothetical protein